MGKNATILQVLHDVCKSLPNWENGTDFQHESTFVKLILVKIAKAVPFRVKKLSYFRLENYKLYAGGWGLSNQIVENPVENVKFHGENRHCSWTFELSPQTFQHVEKTGALYGMYSTILWKTFFAGKMAYLQALSPAAEKDNPTKKKGSAGQA